jgi:dienelactone hydrolase
MTSTPQTREEPARLRDRELVLENGQTGRNIEIPSASPINFHQVISDPSQMPRIRVDAKLFLPRGHDARPVPLVIVVPGSLGVSDANVRHACTFTELGFAACLLDSFGERGVTSTVANQAQFSFAASAYDVLAAWRVLAALPEIDEARIGAQGHSRGGSAVLSAATRRFADAAVGPGLGLRAVLAAYPWCGQQFLDPSVGATTVRILIGDRDEWCSPMQAQAHCHAIRVAGGAAEMRLVGGAHHSFDRDEALTAIPEGRVAPNAPISYVADDGAFIHPLEDRPDKQLVDRDLMVYALKAGYGQRGPRLGSSKGEAALFRADMIAFWKRALR